MNVGQPKPVFKIVSGILLMCIIACSCNNSTEEKKDVVADTTAATVAPVDTVKADTTKMDTAVTKPVKSPN